MTKLLLRLPWFISTPTLIALAATLAFGTNLLVSDYFERSFLDEADPLAAASLPPTSAAPRPPVNSTTRPQSTITPALTTATPSAPPTSSPPASDPSPAELASEVLAESVVTLATTTATAALATTTPVPDRTPAPTPETQAEPPTDPSNTPVPLNPQPTTPPITPSLTPLPTGVLYQGTFRGGFPGHNGSGTAKVLRTEEGQLFLRFEDFSVTNGPDLYVFLTVGGDSNVEAGLNLGFNKATDGNINYDIPAGTDLSAFDSVVIWCDAADIPFAIAALTPA